MPRASAGHEGARRLGSGADDLPDVTRTASDAALAEDDLEPVLRDGLEG